MIDIESMDAQQRLKYIADKVSAFKGGERMKRATECRAYYRTDNEAIASRTKCYASAQETGGADSVIRAVAKENRFASNCKVASSFFRDITDQKVQFIAGEGADVNAVDETDMDIVADVVDPIDRQLKRIGQECLTDALVYGAGYAYLQVVDGNPRLAFVPYTEVVPFYDDQRKLENVIRIYRRDGFDIAEWHTPSTVSTFRHKCDSDDSKGWEFVGEHPQIVSAVIYGDGTVEVAGGKGWSRLPWFEMHAQNDCRSSLTNAARTMIDLYDVVVSDFGNNLVDMADVFINLKDSYGSGMAYGEVLEMARTFKAAESIDSVTTTEVPYQARQTLLGILREGIYNALRGVDVSRISGGTVATATAIRAAYSDIDLWADQAEWHLDDWVQEICDTVAIYQGIKLPPVRVSYTRRIIFDEIGQMDALARQKGVISDKTIYEAHPLVKDAQAELEQVALEQYGAIEEPQQ